MKKLFTILAVALMATASMSASSLKKHTTTSEDNTVVSTETSASNKLVQQYHGKIRFDFQLDDNGRAISKEVFALNHSKEWVPVALYTVDFGDKEVVVNYATYNKKTQNFRNNFEQAHYSSDICKEFFHVPNK